MKPLARPYLPQLVLVLVLGMVTAGQAATLALVRPVWDLVLFPAEQVAETEQASHPNAPAPQQGAEEHPALPASAAMNEGLIRAFSTSADRLVARGWFDDKRMAVLVMVALAGLLLGLVTASAQYLFTRTARLVSFRMIVDLRVKLARHLMGLSMRYHNERRFGDLLSRVSSDVTTTLAAINTCLKDMLLEPLQGLGWFVMALVTAPLPTLGVVLLVPLAVMPISRLTRKVRKRSTKSLTTLGSSVQALTEMFRGIRTVKSFAREDVELDRYRALNDGYLRTSMKMVHSIALMQSWTVFLATAGAGFLALVLGWATIHFSLFESASQMATFFVAIMMVNNILRSFTKSWTRVEESVGASVRIAELIDERVDLVEASNPRRLSGFEEIRFEDVSFRYPGSETEAIESLSLTVRRGETLALVGASGAGKSTIVDLVARFIDPTRGRIAVDGVDLREIALADWNAQYALVGQTPFLFHASITDNIRYGKLEATQAEVEQAARAANIHEFIAALPAGYATDVADMGQRLSGGQRQRMTIARAILKGAPLLLLDEATSALDSESEAEVQRALERLMVGHTVIVIAHRLSTVRNADRIAVLDAGRLVELGTHEELLRREGTYARLHALQDLGSRGEPALR